MGPAKKISVWAWLAAAIVLAAVMLWFNTGRPVECISKPVGIMGTRTRLLAVAPDRAQARGALRDAEAALRGVEARMSRHIATSELSLFNAAPVGEYPLSGQMADVLGRSWELFGLTASAFDVTCLPLIDLWKQAGRTGQLPSRGQIDRARHMGGWRLVKLGPDSKTLKKVSTKAGIDLGGIAKGYGIDRAVVAMRKAGCVGGLVDVGGDVRCFGQPARGHHWSVVVTDPFEPGKIFARLKLGDAAVATSGNYARYVTIGGIRYSHIVDPRTGFPARAAPSVTVIALQAATADAFATALSVRGTAGLASLPRGVEAMLVVGDEIKHRIIATEGFKKYLADVPANVEWRKRVGSR